MIEYHRHHSVSGPDRAMLSAIDSVRANSQSARLCFYDEICSLETFMVFSAMETEAPSGCLDQEPVGERRDVGSQTACTHA
jgi:hypothetical protein